MSNVVVYLRTWVDENDAVVEVFSTAQKAFEACVDELNDDQFVQDVNGNPIESWDGAEDLDIYIQEGWDRSYQLSHAQIL